MKEENKKEKGSPNYTLYCVFFPEKIFSFFHVTANLVKSMNYRLCHQDKKSVNSLNIP